MRSYEFSQLVFGTVTRCYNQIINYDVYLLKFSYLHIAVVYILVNQWIMKGPREMFTHEELVTGTWYGAQWALCFSCGYFAYDQLDMLLYRLYSGFIPAILLHHLILLVCFTLALYKDVTINYLILSLVCEVYLFSVLTIEFRFCFFSLYIFFLSSDNQSFLIFCTSALHILEIFIYSIL